MALLAIETRHLGRFDPGGGPVWTWGLATLAARRYGARGDLLAGGGLWEWNRGGAFSLYLAPGGAGGSTFLGSYGPASLVNDRCPPLTHPGRAAAADVVGFTPTGPASYRAGMEGGRLCPLFMASVDPTCNGLAAFGCSPVGLALTGALSSCSGASLGA